MPPSRTEPVTDRTPQWGAPGSALQQAQSEIARRIAKQIMRADRRALEIDAKTAFRAVHDPSPA
ncbi:hypothetical protein GCM10010315_29960 [Streptomyces luteosporeus]|uniref:Reverse transcriptase domain-containing protein n=1 Tax=Streptomyces luteosporeus TaxID=173856 RepID=A0ABN3TSD5_9ACTN